jgi:hypothetical protein
MVGRSGLDGVAQHQHFEFLPHAAYFVRLNFPVNKLFITSVVI